MVSVQAPVAAIIGRVEGRKGQTRKAAYVDFVRDQSGGCVERVVVDGFDVRQ